MMDSTIEMYVKPEKHGNSNVHHIASDRFPWLGDEENFDLGQRDLDAVLELVHGKTSSVVVRHRPRDWNTWRDVIIDRYNLHWACYASQCRPHPPRHVATATAAVDDDDDNVDDAAN